MILWPAASLHEPLYPAHGPVGVPYLPWEWSVVQQAAFWGVHPSYLTWHRVPFSRKSNNLRAGRKYPWVLYFPLRCCRFALPFPALIPSFLRFQALRARPSASHTQRLSECDAAPPQLPKETKILAVVLLALGSQPAGQPLLH